MIIMIKICISLKNLFSPRQRTIIWNITCVFLLFKNVLVLIYFQSKEKMMRGARRGCLRLKVILLFVVWNCLFDLLYLCWQSLLDLLYPIPDKSTSLIHFAILPSWSRVSSFLKPNLPICLLYLPSMFSSCYPTTITTMTTTTSTITTIIATTTSTVLLLLLLSTTTITTTIATTTTVLLLLLLWLPLSILILQLL